MMDEECLPNRWTQRFDLTWLLLWEMNQRIARQSQTDMPVMVMCVQEQFFLHKSPIGKQCDNHPLWDESTYLIEHWLVVGKTGCVANNQGGMRWA
jgi:hypothetical protein